MHFKLRLIPAATAAFMLVACGGGADTPTSPTPTPSSGVAVDGYIQFAQVVCDLNDNGKKETGETTVYTRADGNFTFPNGCTNGILVSGGRNIDITNADGTVTPGGPFVGLLRAPAGAKVASPLTTLISAGMTPAQITTALGLPANTDLLNDDPMINNPELLKKTVMVQNMLQKITETFVKPSGTSGSVALSAVYTEVAAAFAEVLKTGVKPIANDGKADESVINTLIKAAGDKVLASPTVAAVAPTVITGMNKVGSTNLAGALDKSLKADADKVLVETDPVKIASSTLNIQANEEAAKSIAKQITDGLLTATSTPAEVDAVALKVKDAATSAPSPTPSPSPTPTPTPSGQSILSFDEQPNRFTDVFPYGGAVPSFGAAPAGGVGNALKIVKPAGGEPWGGIAFPLSTAVVFSADKKAVSARVYSTRANVVYKFKVEVPNGVSLEVSSTPSGAANTWSTVTWDFSAVDITKAYTLIAITPGDISSGDTFYVDEIVVGSASSTPTPVTDFLYLADNAITLFNGATDTGYSMTQFQSSAGINVKWPMAGTASIKLNLAQKGNFSLGNGQTLAAAMQITETVAGGMGEIKGYIDNVMVTKSGDNLTVTVPNIADALLYGVSHDGKMKAVINFAGAVANVTNTLSAATNAVNNIILGNVVNYAVNGVSNDFTGMNALRGKYMVKIVVTELPLRKTDGTKFDAMTIEVPTTMSNGVPGTIKPVTGFGIQGYINLTD
jgi:hypothetical protein